MTPRTIFRQRFYIRRTTLHHQKSPDSCEVLGCDATYFKAHSNSELEVVVTI